MSFKPESLISPNPMNLFEKEYIFDISLFPLMESTLPPFLYIFSSDSSKLIELNWGKALSIEIMWLTDSSFIELEFLILKHPCWVLLSLERCPPQLRRLPISLAIDLI